MLTFLVFIAAALIGLLLRQLEIPIPYMLGGILAAFCCKTFYEARFSGSLSLRNAMLGIAGYGIGAHCTSDTIIRMGAELPGVLGASLSTLFVSVCVAIYMARHTFANLLSSVMGCLPGGLTQMTLLMEEYHDADENVVVVSQCLRLFVVEVSVPFLAINLFGGVPDQNRRTGPFDKPCHRRDEALSPGLAHRLSPCRDGAAFCPQGPSAHGQPSGAHPLYRFLCHTLGPDSFCSARRHGFCPNEHRHLYWNHAGSG